MPKGQSASIRRQLEKWEETTGETPEELLNLPEIPGSVLYLFEWFSQLSSNRASNGYSMLPILFSEIEAWSRLKGIRLENWELQCILDLDREFLQAVVVRDSNGSS